MAHGLPNGYTTLFDEDGHPIDVALQPNGTYALAVYDMRARLVLEDIRKALTVPEKDNPWAFDSPWP